MKELSHRRDVELARCQAALLSAHAQLCAGIAARLGDRIRAPRLVELYSRAHELAPLDEAWVRVHTLAECGIAAPGPDDDGAHAPHVEPHGWDALRAALRSRIAPAGDPALHQSLIYEIARADVMLLKVHVRNAAAFAHGLAEWLQPPEAVAQYIDRIDVPGAIAGAVYSLAVTKLAGMDDAPRRASSPPHRLAPAMAAPTPEPQRSAAAGTLTRITPRRSPSA